MLYSQPQRMLDPPRPVNTLPLITPDTIAAAAELIGCERNCLPELRLICRSEPAKKSGQNIPKNRCRTTVAERMVETLAELPFYRGSGHLLKPRTRPPQRNA